MKLYKFINSETFANLLWTAFGLITGFRYYEKQDYLVAGLLGLIGVAYLYRLLSGLVIKD